jgi:hypothetical protein
MKNKFVGKLLEQRAILDAGIEIVNESGVSTINEELATRQNTRRKINRSLDYAGGTANYCGEVFELPLADLLHMKWENDYFISLLLALKKDLSPFKDVTPRHMDKFEVGAILVDDWGWEQTNIDFYCIVKRSGQWITVLPMTKITGPEKGFMTNDEEPGEINFAADPQRKKIKQGQNGKEYGFSFRDYAGGGCCRLWSGKPETSTHYA